jgi:YD repeat-containing protein
MCDAAGGAAWSYDVVGRVVTSRRLTNGLTRDFTYAYNLDGSIATLTYPSGRVITYTPNAAGRVGKVVDTANSINYATGACPTATGSDGACFAPHGALESVKHGVSATFGGYARVNSFNNRLQSSKSPPGSQLTSSQAILATNLKGFFPLQSGALPVTCQKALAALSRELLCSLLRLRADLLGESQARKHRDRPKQRKHSQREDEPET